MRRTQAQGGVSDRPIEHLFAEGSLGPNTPRLTAAQEYAMALMVSDIVTAARVVEIFQVFGGGAPANYQTILERTGILSKEPTREQIEFRDNVVCSLYMVPGAGIKGKQALTAFIRTHEGFKQGTNVLLREQITVGGNYSKVATQLGRYKEVAFARAVHLVARRRIGVALAPSAKGTTLDALLGHHKESY